MQLHTLKTGPLTFGDRHCTTKTPLNFVFVVLCQTSCDVHEAAYTSFSDTLGQQMLLEVQCFRILVCFFFPLVSGEKKRKSPSSWEIFVFILLCVWVGFFGKILRCQHS